MKSLLVASLFSIIMILGVSQAYADVTIDVVQGSGAPGCEETNECYIPYKVTVHPGDKVIWSNDDTAAHTVTSGTPADGPDRKFDSSLFMAGTTFSHTFENAGIYDYFCMVHPWMVGSVIVGSGSSVTEESTISPTTPPTNGNDLILENEMLRDENRDLKLENKQLKNRITSLNSEIDSLKDQIVSMSGEFVQMITQLNEWFRSQLN